MTAKTRRRVIDLAALSPAAPRFRLSGGVCAKDGVTVGRLRIIRDANRFDLVESGDIVAVPFTNNAWDPTIPRMQGLITALGGQLSHPAANGRECGIPTVVGCPVALEVLGALDGQIVTFDSSFGLVVAGEAPVREVETDVRFWLTLAEVETAAECGAAQTRELTADEQWERLKQHGQTMQDFEGRYLGKPKRAYGYLQLGYYILGWDLLDARLNRLLGGGRAIQHPPIIVKERILYFRVERGARYLRPLEINLRIEHLITLLRARREAFDRGRIFFDRLARLDAGNARSWVDLMADLLSHMHFAFFLCSLIEARVRPHLLDVRPEAQATVYELALRHDPNLTAADRYSVIREKHIARDALRAEVAYSAELQAIFRTEPPGSLPVSLRDRAPEFFARVLEHERAYKFGSEDLRLDSNLGSCLAPHCGAADANWVLPPEQLAAYCTEFFRPGAATAPGEVYEAIRRSSPALARLVSFTAAKTGRTVEQVLTEAQRRHADLDALWSTFSNYPNLQALASLARQAAMLRDDAHELITRWQRVAQERLASLGEDAARNGALGDSADIFDLDPEELVVVVEDMPRAGYVRRTARRRKELDKAELQLVEAWAGNPLGALAEYRGALGPIRECLNQQAAAAAAAGHAAAAASYRTLMDRLETRVAELRILISGS